MRSKLMRRWMVALVTVALIIPVLASSADGRGDVAEPIRLPDQLGAVKVDQPYYIDDAELAHVISMREAYGMNTDPAFVRSLYENPTSVDAHESERGIGGYIRFAPTEAPELLRRARAEWSGYQAALRLEREYPNEQIVTEVVEDRVEIRCARCSTNNVRERAEAIVAADIEVTAERVSVPAPVEIAEAGEIDTYINKNDYLIYGLVTGGQTISEVPNPFPGTHGMCTSGFAVQSYYGTYMLTAGHCALADWLGTTWYQGGQVLGHESLIQVGGNVDAMLINTTYYRNNYGRVHYTSSRWKEPITFGAQPSQYFGNTVCHNGQATTGQSGNFFLTQRCGIVDTVWYQPYNYEWDPSQGYNPVFGRCTCLSTYGDSGASIIWFTIYGPAAAGVLMGGGGVNTPFTVFSKWNDIQALWGLSLSPVGSG